MSEFPWVLSAADARDRIDRGATIWDARRKPMWMWQHVAGSQSVRWQAFSQSDPTLRGLLSTRLDAQTETLQTLGVDRDRPVIVVGNPQSPWGEEGRLAWTLRSLGHERTAFVDGGWTALRSLVPLRRGGEPHSDTGAFSPQFDSTWTATREEVRAIANDSTSEWVLLDTRSPREFAGATPYGESRGGRIPGAKSFPLQKLRRDDGRLRSPEAILSDLAQLDIDRDTPVVTYCTGGVRSAFAVAMLVHVGIAIAKNYAGSTWEWSALPEQDYPLEL